MGIDSMTKFWLWLGFAGMIAGTLAILSFWRRFKEEDRFHVVIGLMVTTIAAAAYYAMASGQAVVTFGEHTVYFGRYIDWLFTTPLLLLSLLTIALPSISESRQSRQRLGLIGAVLFADIAMIVTGAIANFSTRTQDIVVWYVASCLWFAIVIWFMYGEVRRYASEHNKKSVAVYSKLLGILTAIWIWYPVVWLLGNSGYAVVSASTEAAIYAVLDVTAKAVFGTITLSLLLNAKGKKE